MSGTYCPNYCDLNAMRYVGWDADYPNQAYKYLFKTENINKVSRKITELLEGVDSKGRAIIIPNYRICEVVSAIFDQTTREISNIFAEDNIPRNQPRADISTIFNRTIAQIVTIVKSELGMKEQNDKLTIWTTVLGDFNEHGLRSHPPIRTNERHPHYIGL